MPDEEPATLDDPTIIYRENRDQIEDYLRESNFYRLSGLITRIAYYGILFAVVNLLFIPFVSDNIGASIVGTIFVGTLFIVLYAIGRYLLKRQRTTAAAAIGYSWETDNQPQQRSRQP